MYWVKAQGKWKVEVCHDGKQHFVNYFEVKEEVEAAKAYNEYKKDHNITTGRFNEFDKDDKFVPRKPRVIENKVTIRGVVVRCFVGGYSLASNVSETPSYVHSLRKRTFSRRVLAKDPTKIAHTTQRHPHNTDMNSNPTRRRVSME